MMDEDGMDNLDVDDDFQDASKRSKVSSKFSEVLGKVGVLRVLPCPFIRPTFFSAAWKSKDLFHVIGSMHEFNMGVLCFAINCFCCLIYTFVSSFESPPLNNALVYKWISFFLSVGWLCAYPAIGFSKYLCLYYGTLNRHMRNILWVMYLLLNMFLTFISFCMFWGGPSSIGIAQAIEFGAGASKVKAGFFVWVVFILCFINAVNHLIFWLTQVLMFIAVLAKFIFELVSMTLKKKNGEGGEGNEHHFYMGGKDIVVEEEQM